MERIVTGIFDTFGAAEEAAGEVTRFGLREDNVQIITKRRRDDGQDTDGHFDQSFDHGFQDVIAESSVVMMGLGATDVSAYGAPLSPLVPDLGDRDGRDNISAAALIKQAGIPNDKGLDYENDLRKGRILWAVHVSDDSYNKIAEMLRHRGAAKVDVY